MLQVQACGFVFESPLPVISSKRFNRNDLHEFIALQTINFLELIQPGDKTNAPTAAVFADDIIHTRYDWRIEDVIYFFQFIRRRQDLSDLNIFGNRLTIIRLNQMVNSYEMARCDNRVNYLSEKYNAKNEIDIYEVRNLTSTPEQVSSHISKITESLKTHKTRLNESFPKSDTEILHQSLLCEFDTLFQSCGQIKNGIRFVKLKNKFLTIEEYCNKKIKNADQTTP